ncbi:ABC transporter substrate-binding protein [Corallincola luteus]|uniref:ABC transporter substrate-binding protein n=1 Tax=Corallincola luteus TaxID=1775177 RepID=A0ABY2AL00_9GAMM|nr:ABC transporter substrate-binding protein [Corallincola luteus]TCI03560.1 ABC transporter substrate-binding protein [Corallincola luteus]
MIFKFTSFLSAWLLLVTAAVAEPLPTELRDDPFKLAQAVSKRTFGRINTEQEQLLAQPELLKEIVREELIPYADYRFAAYKVIGQSELKKSSKEQRDRFVEAFKENLIVTYAQLFTEYNGQKVAFLPGALSDENYATVKTLIQEPGRPDISVDFKMRRNKKTGQWLAYDMVAENLSMLSQKEAELRGLIRQQGLDAVTDLLIEKNQTKIEFQSESEEAK